jgi:hypothetical protein
VKTKLINEIANKNNVDISIEYNTIVGWQLRFSDKETCETIYSSIFIESEIEAMQLIDKFNIDDYEVVETINKKYKKREDQL